MKNTLTIAVVGSLTFGLLLANGANILTTYDLLSRVTRVDYDNGTSIAYTYDAAGNRLKLVAQAAPLADQTAPIIQITHPTTDRLFVTSAGSVTISGTASDATGIAALSCTNDSGGQGSVAGTTSWSAGPIALSNGINRLTVSASDPTGNVGRASLIVVALPPVSGPQVLFQDDFNDNSIDVSKWTNWGNTVAESSQNMQVLTTVTDAGGSLSSAPFSVSSNGVVTISRRLFLHHEESYSYMGKTHFFWGKFFIQIGTLPLVGIHYDDLDYDIFSDTRALHGFYISRNGVTTPYLLSVTGDVSVAIAPVWDTWFDEKITYNPASGFLDYFINNTNQLTYFVGALPPGSPPAITLSMDAHGWWTGHQQLMDDLLVTQAGAAEPVESRDSDRDGMPDWAEMLAGTSLSNAASRLAVQSVGQSGDLAAGFRVEWSSTLGTFYSVDRTTNLLDALNGFTPLRTNIPGLLGTTSFTDTNFPPSGPCFYRINVDF